MNRKLAVDARRPVPEVRRARKAALAPAAPPLVVCGRVTTLGDLNECWLERFDALKKQGRVFPKVTT